MKPVLVTLGLIVALTAVFLGGWFFGRVAQPVVPAPADPVEAPGLNGASAASSEDPLNGANGANGANIPSSDGSVSPSGSGRGGADRGGSPGQPSARPATTERPRATSSRPPARPRPAPVTPKPVPKKAVSSPADLVGTSWRAGEKTIVFQEGGGVLVDNEPAGSWSANGDQLQLDSSDGALDGVTLDGGKLVGGQGAIQQTR